MIARAHAKINLSLEVLGRRDDGYHEIVSVMQLLHLHDALTFRPARAIVLRSSPAGLADDANLVIRAARLLAAKHAHLAGAEIELEKRIPVAAGLGGGSADAATTLLALRSLWGLDLSDQRLAELGASLGSDVPFFLGPPTALASGRGETITPLPTMPPHWLVVVVPRIAIPDKTRRLYGALTPDDYSDGGKTRALAAALEAGAALESDLFVNAFERAALEQFPSLGSCRVALRAAGAPRVHLSGSGPTLFTLLPDEETADLVAGRVRRAVPSAVVLVTRTVAGPDA